MFGRVIECYDRPRFLANVGWQAPRNDQRRSGIAARAMLTAQCFAKGHDAIELGLLSVPFREVRRAPTQYDPTTLHGDANRTLYFGFLTERSMSGIADNFRLIGGVGAYASKTRNVFETQYPDYQGQTQTYHNDYSDRSGGVGASLGLSFTLETGTLGALHLEGREHITTVGNRLAIAGGILF